MDPEIPPEDTKKWKLFQIGTTFFAGVALLHKFIIPLSLKFSHLAGSEYATLDMWVLLPLIFSLWIFFHQKLGFWGSLLSGAVLGFALVETYFCIHGEYSRWTIFSHLLSSMPMAVLSVIGFTIQTEGRKLTPAWFSAITIVFIKLAILNMPQDEVKLAVSTPIPRVELPQANAPLCGAKSVTTSVGRSEKGMEIIVNDCGFSPSSLILMADRFVLQNKTSHGFNLRFFLKNKSRLKTVWNIFIPPNSKKQTPKFNWNEGTAGMLMSDAIVDLGLVAILRDGYRQSFIFNRVPPQIEEVK